MIESSKRSYLIAFLVVSLFGCGILQAATPAFITGFKRRANSDEEELNAGTHIIYVSPVPDSKYITPAQISLFAAMKI